MTGPYCNEDYDECQSNPCNGGACMDSTSPQCNSTYWTSSSSSSYDGSGSSSSSTASECLLDWYACHCLDGFVGLNCAVDVDECHSSPCRNGAACTDSTVTRNVSAGLFLCGCVAGWGGTTCEDDFDECLSSPCQNGGNCTDSTDNSTTTVAFDVYACDCTGGWTGLSCHIDVDECVSNPCQNGGNCDAGPNVTIDTFNCTCEAGWAGDVCDDDIDECLSSPCQNGGNCTDSTDNATEVSIGAYACNCVRGWLGPNCAADIDECVSNPCRNGSVCSATWPESPPDTFNCTCRAGWAGFLCDHDIDECLSSPCQNGGNCTDSTDTTVTVTVNISLYACDCTGGWTGLSCHIDVDECVSNPCQNGGNCDAGPNVTIDTFNCTCEAGWAGDVCDDDIDECLSSPCQNGGNCTDSTEWAVSIGAYACDCIYGWTGHSCSEVDCATFAVELNEPCFADMCSRECWLQLPIADARISSCSDQVLPGFGTQTSFTELHTYWAAYVDVACTLGCIDDTAINFNPIATTDSLTCVTADMISYIMVDIPHFAGTPTDVVVNVLDASGNPSDAAMLEISLMWSNSEGDVFNGTLSSINGIGNYTFSATPIAFGSYDVSLFLGSVAVSGNLESVVLVPNPAPQFNASLSDTGGRLMLDFDRDTNMGGHFGAASNCTGLILAAETGFLGLDPVCIWNSPRLLQIYLGQEGEASMIIPGNNISLTSNVVFTVLKNSFASDQSTVQAPTNPPTPVVIMNIPDHVGTSGANASCDPLALDASGSYNSGGRGWTVVDWELLGVKACFNGNCGSMPDSSAAVTAVREALLTMQNSTRGSIDLVIPPVAAPNGREYTFEVTLSNWMGGGSSTARSTVFKSGAGDESRPAVLFSGSKIRTTTRQAAETIRVDVALPGCYDGASSQVNYEWSALGADGAAMPLQDWVVGGNVHIKNLFIAKDTLPAGENITLALSTQLSGGAWNVGGTVDLEVSRAELVAIVAPQSGTASVSDELVLHATQSFDPDAPDASTFIFQWTCAQGNGSSCAMTANTSPSDNELRFPAGTFAPGDAITFSVAMTKDPPDGRTAVQSALIAFGAGALPPVQLSCWAIPPKAKPSYSTRSGMKANVEDTVRLLGPRWLGANSTGDGVTAVPSYNLIWELMSGSDIGNVDSFAVYPLASPSSDLAFLVIPPNTLQSETSYTFRLHATSPDGLTGYADFMVMANAAPTAGTIEVFEVSTHELTGAAIRREPALQDGVSISGGLVMTTLVVQTSQWVDDPEDTPFTYGYSAISGCDDDAGVPSKSVVLSYTFFTSREVKLAKYSDGVTLVVTAYDTYGASNAASQCLLIGGSRRRQQSTDEQAVLAEVRRVFEQEMLPAYQSGDDDTYIQLLNAVTEALGGFGDGGLTEIQALKQDIVSGINISDYGGLTAVVFRDPLDSAIGVSRMLTAMVSIAANSSHLLPTTQSELLDITEYLLDPSILARSGSFTEDALRNTGIVLDSVILKAEQAFEAATELTDETTVQHAFASRALAALQTAAEAYISTTVCGSQEDGIALSGETFDVYVASLCPSHINGIVVDLGGGQSTLNLTRVAAPPAADSYSLFLMSADVRFLVPLQTTFGNESRLFASRFATHKFAADGITVPSGIMTAEYTLHRTGGDLEDVLNVARLTPICLAIGATGRDAVSDCAPTAASSTETTCNCGAGNIDGSVAVAYQLDHHCYGQNCTACGARDGCGWCSTCGSCFRGGKTGPFFPAGPTPLAGGALSSGVCPDEWSLQGACPLPQLEIYPLNWTNISIPEGSDLNLRVRLSVAPKSNVRVTFTTDFPRPNSIARDHCTGVAQSACPSTAHCELGSASVCRTAVPQPPQIEVSRCTSDSYNDCATESCLPESASSACVLIHTAAQWTYIKIRALADDKAEGTAIATDPSVRVQMHALTQSFDVGSSGDCAFDGITRTSQIMISEADLPSLNFTADLVSACENRMGCDNGGVGEYGVRLSSIPTDIVTVNIADTTIFSVSPARLVFYPDNWNISRQVNVTAIDNHIDDGEAVMTAIAHSIQSEAFGYRDLLNSVLMPARLVDDDEARVHMQVANAVLTEGATGTLVVSLATQPRADVTLRLSVAYTPSTSWYEPSTAVAGLQSAAMDTTCGSAAGVHACSQLEFCVWARGDCQATANAVESLGHAGSRPAADAQIQFIDSQVVIISPQAWEQAVEIRFRVIDDLLSEMEQELSFEVEVITLDSEYVSAAVSPALLTIVDNDSVVVTLVDDSGLALSSINMDESETYICFIHLSREPAAGAIFLQLGESAVLDFPPGILVTAVGWDNYLSRPVSIRAAESLEFTDNGLEYYGRIDQTVVADASFVTVPAGVPSISVTVVDDDESSISFECANESCDMLEGETYQFHIALSALPSAPVSVTIGAIYDQDRAAALMAVERDRCAPNEQMECMALPYCTWVQDSVGASNVTAEFIEDCNFLLLHDACAIMLELVPSYTMEELEQEIDAQFCARARQCLGTQTGSTAPGHCSLNEASVDFLHAGGTPQPVSDRRTLLFEPETWNSSQTLSLSMFGDNISFGNRSIRLEFTSVSTDAYYAENNGSTLVPASSLLLNDREPAGLGVVVAMCSGHSCSASDSLRLVEGSSMASSYTVRLVSEPIGGLVVVRVTVADPAYESVLVIMPDVLAFNASDWDVPKIVTVVAANNSVDDGIQSLVALNHVAISGVFGYRDYIPRTDLIAYVEDDDNNADIEISVASITASEGTASQFGVRLRSPPRRAVELEIIVPGALTASPSNLVFNSDTWQALQIVTVNAVQNNVAVHDGLSRVQALSLQVRVMEGSDSVYFALSAPAPLVVNVVDDDTAGILMNGVGWGSTSSQVFTLNEGDAFQQFAVSLRSEPTSNVQVSFSLGASTPHSDTPDLTISTDSHDSGQQTIVIAPSDWNVPRTVFMIPVDNQVAEHQKNYVLDFLITSLDSNYNGPDRTQLPRSARVIVVDDEQASLSSSSANTAITETGPGRYNITMSSQPHNDSVTVSISAAMDPRFSVSPSTIVFDNTNWHTPQEVEVHVANYLWGSSVLLWNTLVTHTISTTDEQYSNVQLADMNVFVQPRAGCARDAVTVAVTGPGFTGADIVAGEEATFEINVMDGNGRTCVNSVDIVSVGIVMTNGFDPQPAGITTHDGPTVSIQESGILTVVYRVRPFGPYNLVFYKETPGGRMGDRITWPATEFPGANPRLLRTVRRSAPQPRAIFANSLDEIVISFDVQVFETSLHQQICSTWFVPASVTSIGGESAQCVWNSPTTLNVVLGLNNSLALGSSLQFEQLLIRSYNSYELSAPVTVERALSPDVLTAKLAAPGQHGTCGALAFDASESFGGRAQRLQFQWSVTPAGDNTVLDEAVRIANIENAAAISVDGAQVHVGTQRAYNMGVDVTNSQGNTSYTYAHIQLDPNPIPVVTIAGSNRIVAHRSESLDFHGTVQFPGACARLRSEIVWQLLRDGVEQFAGNAAGQQLTISRNSLSPGMHTLLFTATAYTPQGQRLSNHDSVDLQIVRSGLVSIISGSRHTQYEMDSAGILEDVIIDGSGSFDPDVFDDCTTDCTTLEYVWTCFVGDVECVGLTPPPPNAEGSERWVVLADLRRNAEYIFSLTVVDHSDLTRRSQAASQIVTVVEQDRYAVSLVSRNQIDDTKMDANDRLSLEALVDHDQVVEQWEWSLVSDMSPTPVNSDWIASATSSANSLVFQRNALQPGLTYTFRAQAIMAGTYRGNSDITVIVDAGPTNRFNEFTVSPVRGRALMDSFSVNAGSHWQDDDLPLTYAFGYDMNGIHMLTSKSAAQTSYVHLPEGNRSLAFDLRVTCHVYDNFGVTTNNDGVAVQVIPAATTLDGLNSLVSDKLDEAADLQDSQLLLQICVSAGHALNNELDNSTTVSSTSIRESILGALYGARGSLKAAQSVAASIGAVIAPGISSASISESLALMHRVFFSAENDSQGRRLQAQGNELKSFDQATAEAILSVTSALYNAARQQPNRTLFTNMKSSLTEMISNTVTSALSKHVIDVVPFVWGGSYFQVHAEKHSSAGTMITDSYDVQMPTSVGTSGETTIVTITWNENPYDFAQTTNLASPVFGIALSPASIADHQIVLKAKDVGLLPNTDQHPLSRYVAVTWDTDSSDWVGVGSVLVAGTTVSFAVSSLDTPAEFAIQVVEEFYAGMRPPARGCDMVDTDCGTTTEVGLLGLASQTPVGMQLFVRCPSGCDLAAADDIFDTTSAICSSAAGSTGSTAGGIFAVTIRSGRSYQIQAATASQISVCEIPNVDCVGSFTQCGADCGMAEYQVTTAQSGTGAQCPHADGYTRQCGPGEGICPLNTNCLGAWPTCVTDCTPSVYRVTTPQSGTGTQCPIQDGVSRLCNPGDGACPVNEDCVGDFTQCGADCANKMFVVTTIQSGTGAQCPHAHGHAQVCAPGDGICPRDCVGSFSRCDASCNQKRYSIALAPLNGGTPCPQVGGTMQDCTEGDGDCPVSLFTLTEDNENGFLLAAVLISGAVLLVCVLIGCFCLQKGKTSALANAAPSGGPRNAVPGNFYGPQSTQFPPQPHQPHQPDSQQAPAPAPETREPKPAIRPVTPSHVDLEETYDDQSASATPRMLTPITVSSRIRPVTPSRAGGGDDRAAQMKRYREKMRATTPQKPRGVSNRTAAEDFGARVGEAKMVTSEGSRTQQWVQSQSAGGTRPDGLAEEAVRLTVKPVGKRDTGSDAVLKAEKVLAASKLRRQASAVRTLSTATRPAGGKRPTTPDRSTGGRLTTPAPIAHDE